jgi:FAD/FMN-containing dehydrogenase
MSKIAQYLQEHLIGEVMTSVDARRYFATDNSIFNLPPAVVVYPRNENDVRKTARFAWQLAERGRVIPITARGNGTDQAGAALGSGIMLVFPAHLNRILELDSKTGSVTVEAGINYGKLQQTLKTHGRFLPPYPASFEYSTVGGAVANNAAGEKSIKYGDTSTYVSGLRVVLANGEVIITGRLSKRDLSKKLGMATFEGEIYRSLDALFEEHHGTIAKMALDVTKNNAGYNLLDIKRPDGSFDLTPLFVGSQGTLGIVTEIILDTEPYSPNTTLFMAGFESVEHAQLAINELRDTDALPSALEMVDSYLLDQVQAANPNLINDVVQPPFPAVTLFVEYDANPERTYKKAVKRAERIFAKLAGNYLKETDPENQEHLWKLRQTSSWLLGRTENHRKAVPVIDDGIVPVAKFQELLTGVYDMFAKEKMPAAVWGHAGDGNIHLAPMLNLSEVGDRQTAFRLLEEYNKLLLSLGGSTSGQGNDGRLRAPYLEKVYGSEVYALFKKVKAICDPYGTLNPGVKIGVSLDDIKPLVRGDFSLEHAYDHLPRS